MTDNTARLEAAHENLPEMLEYLNDLRESGATNMFGARPYLQEEFGLERKEASAVLAEWMETFKKPVNVTSEQS